MHHQFLILKYLFNRENIKANFDSIDTFFDDGISFPKLISIAYSDDIPDVIENPANFSERYDNVSNTLLFLCNRAQTLMKRLNGTNLSWHFLTSDTVYYTHKERKRLLSVILTGMCFTMTANDILLKSNRILKSINVQFKSTRDIINGYFILSLLHVITDGKVKIVKNIGKKDFDKIMQQSFSIAKVPLVIDRKVMSKLKTDYFYIQIQIIFEVCADKIDTLINDKFYPFDVFEDESLFKTVFEISKKFTILDKFENAYKNDFIPKFVMNYLSLSSIKNVNFVESNDNHDELTENEINNIKATINFLSFKDDFKVLSVDFENPSNREFSTRLFFRTFCNVFFLKNSKKKMIERCITLLINKKNWIPENISSEFSKFDTFLYLVHFCALGNFDLKLNNDDVSDEFASELFKKAKIPMIINKNNLSNFSYENSLPDSLFYQLQFIFDKIDDPSSGSQRIVESLLVAKKKIQDVKVPLFKLIILKVKSQSIKNILEITRKDENIFQLEKQKNVDKDKDDEKDKKKETMINETEKERNDDDDDEDEKEKLKIESEKQKIKEKNEKTKIKLEKEKSKESNVTEKDKIKKKSKASKDESNDNGPKNEDDDLYIQKCRRCADVYWRTYYSQYTVNDGILYSKNEKFENEEKYDNAIHEVITKVKEAKKEEKKVLKKKKKKDKKKKESKPPFNPNLGPKVEPGLETPLYKIFYYDERNDKWIFDEGAFEQFVEYSKINSNEIKCPVISYMPSKESELLQANCLYIKGMYPFLDTEEEEEEEIEEQIFVYAFCEKTLSEVFDTAKLTYEPELNLIKPIILTPHIPKKKETIYRIDVIMLRLYIFLSLISDLKAVIIDGKNSFLSQESSINVINAASNSVSFLRNDFYPNNKEEQLVEYFKINENKKDLDCVYNGKHLKIKEHQLIYLLDKDRLKYNDSYYFAENQEILERAFSRPQGAVMNLIDIHNFDTYKNYLNLIKNISLKTSSTYSEVLNNFQCIEASDICNMFFKLIYNQLIDFPHTYIIKSIEHLYHLYKEGYKEDELNILNRIQKDFDDHIPQFCIFIREMSKIIIDEKKLNKKEDTNKISDILKKTKIEYMDKIKQLLKRKQVWSKGEIENITNRLNCLLKNKFFEATKEFEDNEDHFDSFQYHYDDLESEISKSESDIKLLFKKHFDDMEVKKSVKPKNFKDDINQGANYSVKETENIHELTVEVEINSDLKSVIQQDF